MWVQVPICVLARFRPLVLSVSVGFLTCWTTMGTPRSQSFIKPINLESKKTKLLGVFLCYIWIYSLLSYFGYNLYLTLSRNLRGSQWNRREGVRAQPLKVWCRRWGYDKNPLEPTRSKMAEDSTSLRPWASFYAHCNTLAKWYAHRRHESSQANH